MCEACDVVCPTQGHLDIHKTSQKHIDALNGVVHTMEEHYCEVCNHSYPSATHLEIHFGSTKHARSVAVAASYATMTGKQLNIPAEVTDDPQADNSADLITAASLATDDPHESKLLVRRQESAAIIAAKKHYCELCTYAGHSPAALERHFKSQKHIDNAAFATTARAATPQLTMNELHALIEKHKKKQRNARANELRKQSVTKNIAAKAFHCSICNSSFGSAADLKLHLKTKTHIRKAAEAGQQSLDDPDTVTEQQPMDDPQASFGSHNITVHMMDDYHGFHVMDDHSLMVDDYPMDDDYPMHDAL